MKKILTALFFSSMLFVATLHGQIYLPLADNMFIGSNSYLKIIQGNYILQDAACDGLIRIDNAQNITIDGDSVYADGIDYCGYLISISNSHHIRIKNFEQARHFKYAVRITNSHHIEIDSCVFSYNKVDSADWIDVWAGYTQALGGGVMCYQCDSIHIHHNIMNMQNDGVALYNSRKADVHHNLFDWNTSYGVRMYFTDSSHIHYNQAAHINRPQLDPSDCAALLMIVSNENLVDHNDLSYSGDGVFLGQYQHSATPNNNIFLYNQCSGSPHNAIEATFADGNIYKYNICNSSHYGFWLGYSFNSLVDSNDVSNNHHSGIAIDRGFNNNIHGNNISFNPIGIELWEGNPPASGYSAWTSHHYNISDNYFERNNEALHASNTENIILARNEFIKNHNTLYFDGTTVTDTLTANLFDQSTLWDIQNNGSVNQFAPGNLFSINDTNYIADKIYDHLDNLSLGQVTWHPFVGLNQPFIQTSPPLELTEPPAVWSSYPEVCGWMGVPVPITVEYDTIIKQMGAASVHLITGTGWYNSLNFRPDGNNLAHWDLTNYGYLSFWIRSINNNVGDFQYFHVRVGNTKGGYYRYNSNGTVLNQSLGIWKNYIVPLYGSTSWPRQSSGQISLSDINYVEVNTDSYGVGYELWLDGVQFLLATDLPPDDNDLPLLLAFPNPANESMQISISLNNDAKVSLKLHTLQGKCLRQVEERWFAAGEHQFPLDLRTLSPGFYVLSAQIGETMLAKKIVIRP